MLRNQVLSATATRKYKCAKSRRYFLSRHLVRKTRARQIGRFLISSYINILDYLPDQAHPEKQPDT
jgi:hypothetical protein